MAPGEVVYRMGSEMGAFVSLVAILNYTYISFISCSIYYLVAALNHGFPIGKVCHFIPDDDS